MILNISKKTAILEAQGKHVGKTDLQYMKQAKDFLKEELAIALEIPYDEVMDYVKQQIKLA